MPQMERPWSQNYKTSPFRRELKQTFIRLIADVGTFPGGPGSPWSPLSPLGPVIPGSPL